MEELKGWFLYDGIITQQCEPVGDVFKNLFLTTKPKRVLEIGTAFGGLTLIIRNLLDELSLNDTELVSYDVFEKHHLNERIQEGLNIDIRIKDVFEYGYERLTDEDEGIIKSFIQGEGTTIVLCDGGRKPDEFRILSQYLKEGDIIMAHDYAPNINYFNEHIISRVWNWLEIQDSEIEDTCNDNNLHPFMEEDFRQVVWVCKIKK